MVTLCAVYVVQCSDFSGSETYSSFHEALVPNCSDCFFFLEINETLSVMSIA